MKLFTSHVEQICYVHHMELQSTNTPWWVVHQGETPTVSTDPCGYPDLVTPDPITFLGTHTDNNMCHHSFKNKQINKKVLSENGSIGTVGNMQNFTLKRYVLLNSYEINM